MSKAKPSRSSSADAPAKRVAKDKASPAKPKPKAAGPEEAKLLSQRFAAKPRSARPKLKPKHTATAKQRAEADKKRKR